MKSFLLFLITTISSISFAQNKVFDKTDSLRKIIVREFLDKGYDSVRVTKLFDSLNKKFKVKKIMFVKNKTGLSHYFPWGLMLINATRSENKDFVSVYNEWIGELPHAKQFSERRLFYSGKALKGFFQTLSTVIFHSKDYREDAEEMRREICCSKLKAYLWTVYKQTQYSKVGSLEYEAHELIEPYLKNFFLQKLQPKSLASL